MRNDQAGNHEAVQLDQRPRESNISHRITQESDEILRSLKWLGVHFLQLRPPIPATNKVNQSTHAQQAG